MKRKPPDLTPWKPGIVVIDHTPADNGIITSLRGPDKNLQLKALQCAELHHRLCAKVDRVIQTLLQTQIRGNINLIFPHKTRRVLSTTLRGHVGQTIVDPETGKSWIVFRTETAPEEPGTQILYLVPARPNQ